jgi:uncharacterized membrane protein (DUF4010 family)
MPTYIEAAKSLGAALGIGILIGIEREHRKGEEPGRAAAGIRTFSLVSLAGAIAKLLGDPVLLGVVGALVTGGALLSYLRTNKTDPGLTTEVALVVTFLLGTMAVSNLALAVGTGVLVALILASRTQLHRFARQTLSAKEIEDFLILAAAALVVLPLLPNRGIGPYGAVNLFTLWRLVVIIMTINGAGYIALRALGAKYGLVLAGFVSGFVSSAATIGGMGARSRANKQITVPAIAGAVLSSCATVLQMLVLVGATSPATLRRILLPMLAAGAVSVVFGAASSLRAARMPAPDVPPGRAFDLKAALLLATTVSLVMILSSLCLRWLGDRGLILAIALAGFADTHSAAISAATLVQSGSISPATGAVPILCAFTTNTVTKVVVAYSTGTKQFAGFVMLGVLLMAAAAWAAFVVS